VRVFQYQGLAEPLPQPAPAAAPAYRQPVAPDLVARAAVLPAAILAGSLFFAPAVAAPVLTPRPAIVAPDLLRLPAARAHLQPASVLVSAAPFPEGTSADRWKPILRDFLWTVTARPWLEPQSALGRAAPYPEAATADRWKPILRDWLYVPRARPSLEPASVLVRAAPFAEAASVDRFKPTFPDFLRVPLPRPYLEQVPFAPRVVTAPVLTLGWASSGPDWLRTATGRAHLEPPSLLGRAAPYAEAVSADRWKPILRDFLRVPLGLPALLPTSVSAFPIAAPLALGWASFGPDWLRAAFGRAHLEQSVIPPRVIAAPTFAASYGPDLLRATIGRAHLASARSFW
jgi:hypothetical protein